MALGVVVAPSTASAQQLSLTWVDNASGQASFIVQRAIGVGGTFSQVALISPGIVTYTDTAVSLGTTYCYQVAATNSAGTSAFTAPGCGTPTGGVTLTVVKAGAGSGTVTSSPAGINCGPSCSFTYLTGSALTLTAAPAAGSTFSGWSGGGCAGTAPCTLAGNTSTTVTATFAVATAPVTVSSLAPNQGSPGATVPVTISGSGFAAGAAVSVSGTGVTASSVTVVSPTQLTATLTIGGSATLGARNVTVTNSGGGSGTLTGGFTVIAAVTVSSMTPTQGAPGTVVPVTITGSAFVAGAAVGISGGGVTASNVTVVSSTQLTATLTIAGGAAPGARNVTVTNSGGAAGTLTGGFTVLAPVAVSSMTPNQGPPGAAGQVTITGSGFVAGASVSVSGGSVTLSNVSVASPTQLTATLTVGGGAAPGARDVTVTNAGGGSGTLTGGFTVLPAVTATAMTPNQGVPGAAGAVTITGSGFVAGASVSVSGTGVTASNVTVISATQVTATLTVAAGAALGARDVTVTNAGGGSGTLTGGFTVIAAVAVTSMAPAQGTPGIAVPVTITGSGFAAGASVAVSGAGVTASNVTVASPTQLTATLTISSGAALGARNVTVTNAGGGSGTLTAGFTMVAPVIVTSMTPNQGSPGAAGLVTITGSGFAAGATVSFSGTGVTASSVTMVSQTQLTANLTVASGAALGARNVTITNAGGASGTLPGGFTVIVAVTVSAMSPTVGAPGMAVPVTITGSGFGTGATVSVSGAGVTASNIVVVSATQVTATLTIAGGATLGARDVTVTNAGGGSGTLTGGFTVVTAVTANAMSPSQGAPGAAVPVTISGSGFAAGASVSVSGTGVTASNVTVVSPTQLTATLTIAGGAALGARNVTVTNAGGSGGTLTGGFTVVAAVVVSSTAPNQGPAGTTGPITITGSGFAAGATVSFGGAGITATNVSVLSLTQLTATLTISSGAVLGARDVTVTNAGGNGGTLAGGFTVVTPVTIGAMTPPQGVSGSAVPVTITGSGFVAGATVSLSGAGITVSNVSVISPTQLTATLILGTGAALGARDVTVTNVGGNSGALAGGFTVIAPATVSALAPNQGLPGTALPVTITGSGFVSGASVSFSGAGITASSVSVVSPTQLTATLTVAPGAALGPRAVTVTNPGGNSGTLPGGFTVVAPVAIGAIAPAQGLPGVAVPVTITGSGFAAGATVSLGGAGITLGNVNIVSPTQLTATLTIASGAAVGARDVTVTNPGGNSGTLAGGFTVVAPVTVGAIAPTQGAPGSAVPVTITGSGFAAGATMSFSGAGITASNVSVISPTQLTATLTIASGAVLGARDVTVTNAGGNAGTLTGGFTIVAAATISAIAPNQGAPGAAVPVTITGSGFVAGAAVAISGAGVTASNIVVASPTQLTATLTIATGTALGARDITVTSASGGSATLTGGFTVIAVVAVNSVAPAQGAPGDTVPVTIAGAGFAAGATVSIAGGGVTVSNVAVASATQLTASLTIAAGTALGARDVTVTNAGGGSATLAGGFTVIAGASVNSMAPAQGAPGVAVPVTITGSGFAAGATVAISGTGVTAANVTVVSPSQLTATLTVGGGSALGARDVTVSSVGGSSATLSGGFTVVAAVTASAIAPTQGALGVAVPVTITGSGFAAGATVSISGTGITAGDIVVASATQLTATLTIAPGAALGARDVTVTGAGGSSTTLPGGFAVVAPASISSIAPNQGSAGTAVPVTITGAGFGAGATVSVSGAGVTVGNLVVASPTQLTATLTIAAGAAVGARDVTVTGAGGSSGTLAGGFTVLAAVVVNSMTPTQGAPGVVVPVAITGSGFAAGATVSVGGAGVAASNVSVLSPSQLTATLTIASGATLGARDVTVANAGGSSSTLPDGFTVIAPATVSALAPNQGIPGAAASVTITGGGFAAGATVSIGGGGIAASGVTVVSPTQLTATLTIDGGAALGARDVTVTNVGGSSGTLTGGFTVVAAVAVSSMAPTQGAPGVAVPVTITGTGFGPGATVNVAGSGIVSSNVTVVSSTQLTATLTIAGGAAAGARDVTVTSEGGSATLAGGFTVLAVVTVNSMTPPQGAPGLAAPVTITGTGFAAGATVTVSGGGVSMNSVTVMSSTRLVAMPTISSGATPGPRDVTVTNAGGSSAMLPGGFTVVSATPPALTLAYSGKLRDRVGQGNAALGPDGALDGTLAVTLTASGGRTVTGLRLESNAPGTWDTSGGSTFWALAVAPSLDGALLNTPGTMAVNFPVADGGTFVLFASDYQGMEFLPGRTLTLVATFSDGSTATAATTVVNVGSARLTMAYNGLLRDRAGQGNAALGPDGAPDGTLTVSLSATGGRTVTFLRLDSSAPGTWDTSRTSSSWVLAVAPSLDGALVNHPGTMAVNFPVADGGSFVVFAADYQGTEFLPGRTLTLTATFSDGTTATATTTVPTPPPAQLAMVYNGKLRDRVGQSNTALGPDGALDGALTVTMAASGGRTVTSLRLDSSAPGTWDTSGSSSFWVLAVAPSMDGPVLNAPGSMRVNFPVADGGSFVVFASDYQGKEFLPGRRLTLTATFSDGSSATAVTTAP